MIDEKELNKAVPGATPAPKSAAPKSTTNSLFELAKMFLIALAIILPLRYLVFSPFIVKGESMEPNYRDGEYLIVDEISYQLHDPKRGDVIVFHYPKDTTQYYIKRIIGLPHETVRVDAGQIFIQKPGAADAARLTETQYLDKDLETAGDLSVTLGDDEYFVLGDNRGASSDSRVWGVLNKKFIVGRSWLRALPVDRFGVFHAPAYDPMVAL